MIILDKITSALLWLFLSEAGMKYVPLFFVGTVFVGIALFGITCLPKRKKMLKTVLFVPSYESHKDLFRESIATVRLPTATKRYPDEKWVSHHETTADEEMDGPDALIVIWRNEVANQTCDELIRQTNKTREVFQLFEQYDISSAIVIAEFAAKCGFGEVVTLEVEEND